MRLSDVRRREPKLIYLNHSTPPRLTEAATRCSNRLLDSVSAPLRDAPPCEFANQDLLPSTGQQRQLASAEISIFAGSATRVCHPC